MRTIAILGQKGGSGKTTCAVHLAVAAARCKRKVLLVDLDPQQSAASWGRRRAADALSVTVRTARLAEVPGIFADAKAGAFDLLLADCPGRADAVAMALLERVDLALVPCRPSILDVEASVRTADQAKTVRARHVWIVLNAIPPRGTRHAEAQSALEGVLPVAPASLGSRVAYSDALVAGASVEELDPRGEAAREIRRLWRWIEAN